MQREDVQDQGRAIDHLDAEPRLQGAEVPGRELLVEDHGVGIGPMDLGVELLHLAPADRTSRDRARIATGRYARPVRRPPNRRGRRVRPGRLRRCRDRCPPAPPSLARTGARSPTAATRALSPGRSPSPLAVVCLHRSHPIGGAELAQQVVETNLVVGRLGAIADRSRRTADRSPPRGTPWRGCRGSRSRRPGTAPRCSTGSEPVTSITGVLPVSTTPAPSTAPRRPARPPRRCTANR